MTSLSSLGAVQFQIESNTLNQLPRILVSIADETMRSTRVELVSTCTAPPTKCSCSSSSCWKLHSTHARAAALGVLLFYQLRPPSTRAPTRPRTSRTLPRATRPDTPRRAPRQRRRRHVLRASDLPSLLKKRNTKRRKRYLPPRALLLPARPHSRSPRCPPRAAAPPRRAPQVSASPARTHSTSDRVAGEPGHGQRLSLSPPRFSPRSSGPSLFFSSQTERETGRGGGAARRYDMRARQRRLQTRGRRPPAQRRTP